MIPIEVAVLTAKEYAGELYAEEELTQMRVEEIESDDDDEYWFVTLGWVEPATRTLGSVLQMQESKIEKLPRVYKIFKIDSTTGRVKSMKIRD